MQNNKKNLEDLPMRERKAGLHHFYELFPENARLGTLNRGTFTRLCAHKIPLLTTYN